MSKDYGNSPYGWQLEKAHKEGFTAGYLAGTEDMRKAHGNNQVGAASKETEGEEVWYDGVQGAVETPICHHDGEEDASDCPMAEETPWETIHITVARFPPFK